LGPTPVRHRPGPGSAPLHPRPTPGSLLLRTRSTPGFLLLGAVLVAAALALGACGEPPQPLPTAPPEQLGGPSASAYPPVAGWPSNPAPVGLTSGGLPTVPPATFPATTLPSPTPSATATRTGPPPAPRCTHGPTAAQIIAVVRTHPGIPTGITLEVKQGPYCADTWQFTVLGEAGRTPDQVDPLLVVTKGPPSALTVVEAGQDVCSERVLTAAPPGIRVLACG
jgi:hypothetical protein